MDIINKLKNAHIYSINQQEIVNEAIAEIRGLRKVIKDKEDLVLYHVYCRSGDPLPERLKKFDKIHGNF